MATERDREELILRWYIAGQFRDEPFQQSTAQPNQEEKTEKTNPKYKRKSTGLIPFFAHKSVLMSDRSNSCSTQQFWQSSVTLAMITDCIGNDNHTPSTRMTQAVYVSVTSAQLSDTRHEQTFFPITIINPPPRNNTSKHSKTPNPRQTNCHYFSVDRKTTRSISKITNFPLSCNLTYDHKGTSTR